MGEDMNGYQPPVVEGLDGDDSSGVSTYGTEWVYESFYVYGGKDKGVVRGKCTKKWYE